MNQCPICSHCSYLGQGWILHVCTTGSCQNGYPPSSGRLECRIFGIQTTWIRHQLKQCRVGLGEPDICFSQFKWRIPTFIHCRGEII